MSTATSPPGGGGITNARTLNALVFTSPSKLISSTIMNIPLSYASFLTPTRLKWFLRFRCFTNLNNLTQTSFPGGRGKEEEEEEKQGKHNFFS